MSELIKKEGIELPELSEEAINEMRAWSGIDPESKVSGEKGIITSMFENYLLGGALIREFSRMFHCK